MTTTNDEWVRVAMTDDGIVAEFLLRLKQMQANRPSAVIPLRWGLRLPRSRHAAAASGTCGGGSSSMRCDAVSFRKGSDSSTRCSPTTPLSWSGGSGGAASPSNTADEESSHHDGTRSPSGVRSKGTAATAETASTSTKRSRKRKTFSELKEEEGHLIKEKLHLKKEIATLNASSKEHRVRNQSLKKIKRELIVQPTKNSSSNVVPSTPPAKCHNHPQSDSGETDNASSSHDRFFLLPDLNMVPDLNTIPAEEEDTGMVLQAGSDL